MGVDLLSFISQGYKKFTINATTAKIPAVGGADFEQFRDNGAGSTGVYETAFDDTLEESIYVGIVSPADYVPGTDIIPVLTWSTQASGTNKKVSWGIEACTSAAGGSFGVTTIAYANTSSNGDDITAYANNYTKFAAIDGSGFTNTNNAQVFRIFRNATGAGSSTDDFAGDAFLVAFNMVYYADKIGLPENPIA